MLTTQTIFTLVAAIGLVGLAMAGLAVGVFTGKRCLRGGCHGRQTDPDGKPRPCPNCEKIPGL